VFCSVYKHNIILKTGYIIQISSNVAFHVEDSIVAQEMRQNGLELLEFMHLSASASEMVVTTGTAPILLISKLFVRYINPGNDDPMEAINTTIFNNNNILCLNKSV
jgi:hypothetical protein